MARAFHHELNPMLTVESDFDTPYYDKVNAYSRKYRAAHKEHHAAQRHETFAANPKWTRCFSGLDNRKQVMP